ncbi:MAG TPA: amino acid adenylation domain-containing protein, partial [Thermoanaerobaculia bacterium]|nr:amino acid adenylation domain-containing protein [Thermoanaerobaculia bacterium]
MLSLQNAVAEPPGLPGLEAAPVEVGRDRAKFDLRLGLKERGGALEGEVEYRRDLFDPTTVERWVRQLGALVEAVVAAPGRRLSELPLLPAAERHALLHEWGGSASGRPEPTGLDRLVARRVEERPEAIAVESEAGQLSYAELDRRAGALGRRLTAAGAGPDRPVALFLERSPELVVALVAAARAAAPAVPLDPDYPRERLAFMLADSGAAAVVTAAGLRAELPETAAAILEVDSGAAAGEGPAEPAPNRRALAAGAPAYVLYTSGSTGRPNGVAVPQAAVAEHLRAMAEALPLAAGDTVLYKTPAGFDPSVWELWAPLVAGARLALARPGGQREPAYLAGAVRRYRATVLRLVPSLFEALLEEPGFAGGPGRDGSPLRRLFVGGEVLPPAAAGRFLAGAGVGAPIEPIELINSYGPTETTVTATWHRVRPGAGGAVPIGRPVGNLRARVVDRRLRPVPVGAAGELALSGPTLASGYRRRPALTAERFVPDPFADGAEEAGGRLYRTGDLVRMRPDGALAFLGRLDGQVKLRGMRVELGEIEAVLAAHPAVERAAARLWDGPGGEGAGDRRLVAYAVARPGAGAGAELAAELGEALARRLPPALVPAAVLLLPELPLLPNGKVDRRALPAPEPVREGASRVPPRGPLEELVSEVWSEVLKVGGIGAHDDFFDLGGHSLLATRVTARLRQRTGVEVPLRRLFEERTVAGLAAALAELRSAGGRPAPPPPLVRVPREGSLPAMVAASFAQERLWFLDRFGEDPSAYNLPALRRLRGALDLPALAGALAGLVRRHESLRTLFRAAPEDAPEGAYLGSAAVQVVQPPGPVALPVIALRALAPPSREAELRRLALAAARRSFDLAAGPLLRAAAVRIGRDDHALLLALHHVIADGWSMGVLFRELVALYRLRLGSAPGARPPELPALPIQYADFALWQRRWLSGEVLAGELAFWRERLAGAPPVVELPADRPRPAVRAAHGGLLPWRLPEPATEGLRGLARERGASLFIALLAGFQALLARVTGATDLSVGTPVANRTRAETEGLIGFFTNTLVLRADLGGDPTFAELLERVREVALEAFGHQELPFEKLVQELRPERRMS